MLADLMEGNVRFRVRFHDSWSPGDEVALILATAQRQRYVFRLPPLARNQGDGNEIPGPFAGNVWLAIERNGVLLRRERRTLEKERRDDQSLTLTAS